MEFHLIKCLELDTIERVRFVCSCSNLFDSRGSFELFFILASRAVFDLIVQSLELRPREKLIIP